MDDFYSRPVIELTADACNAAFEIVALSKGLRNGTKHDRTSGEKHFSVHDRKRIGRKENRNDHIRRILCVLQLKHLRPLIEVFIVLLQYDIHVLRIDIDRAVINLPDPIDDPRMPLLVDR